MCDSLIPAAGFAAWISTFARNPRSGEIRDRRTFRNLIVDAGMDALASVDLFQLVSHMGVGTSSVEPAAGQTALGAPAAIGGVLRHQTGFTGDGAEGVGGTAPNYYGWFKRVIKSAPAATDMTLREIGFFRQASGGTMFNRQLFRNSAGVPTDFTLLAGEELVAELEVRAYVPTADMSGTIQISGEAYNYTVRALSAQNTLWSPRLWGPSAFSLITCARVASAQTLIPATSNPSSLTNASSLVTAPYVAGTFYQDITYTWEPAGFAAPIGYIVFGNGRFQSVFSRFGDGAPIPKNGLSKYQHTVRLQWSRYTPPA